MADPWHLCWRCNDGHNHYPVPQADPLKNINTQLLAYIISVAILIGAEAFNGAALTVQGVVLCLLNAVIVALAANGTYDAATTGMVKKVKEEEFPLEEVVKDA